MSENFIQLTAEPDSVFTTEIKGNEVVVKMFGEHGIVETADGVPACTSCGLTLPEHPMVEETDSDIVDADDRCYNTDFMDVI